MNVFGLRIIFTLDATKDTEDRLFPASRHRSARIRKKLLRRHHGHEFRQAPAMYQHGDTLFAHPAFRQKIERETIHQVMSPFPRVYPLMTSIVVSDDRP